MPVNGGPSQIAKKNKHMKNQSIYYLRDNLRKLIEMHSSVSHAASALDINRQQLNKYLVGTSTPSIRTLATIASYFNLTVDDMFLPPDKFARRAPNPDIAEHLPDFTTEALRAIVQRGTAVQDALAGYCGNYFRISSSPNLPYKIMRAYTRIYQEEGLTLATTVEVHSACQLHARDGRFIRKLHSLVVSVGDRIYFLDASQRMRLSASIFYPETIPKFEFLRGSEMSVSDTGLRKIYQIPVLLQKLANGPLTKSQVKACGFFDSDSPEIGDEALRRLNLEW